jgi:hypothetical protein
VSSALKRARGSFDPRLYLDQQAIDTTTPSGRLIFQITGAFAEFERTMIRERIHAGLARAKKASKTLGRKEGTMLVDRTMLEAARSTERSLGTCLGRRLIIARCAPRGVWLRAKRIVVENFRFPVRARYRLLPSPKVGGGQTVSKAAGARPQRPSATQRRQRRSSMPLPEHSHKKMLERRPVAISTPKSQGLRTPPIAVPAA